MLKITSVVLPSSQIDPPPEITTSGKGFTVIVIASFSREVQRLESIMLLKVYTVVTLGATGIESIIFERVIGVGIGIPLIA